MIRTLVVDTVSLINEQGEPGAVYHIRDVKTHWYFYWGYQNMNAAHHVMGKLALVPDDVFKANFRPSPPVLISDLGTAHRML